MATYPLDPRPASVSAPAIIDESLRFVSDSGYEQRRALHSRPRRRYTLEYLGQDTVHTRVIRDFLQQQRLGVLPFEFVHPTAMDACFIYANSTPVIVQFQHAMVSGQWLGLVQGPAALNTVWKVTYANTIQVTLNGSQAVGGGTVVGYAIPYMPYAVARMQSDTFEAPTKLLGPDQVTASPSSPNTGYFNFTVVVEEIF